MAGNVQGQENVAVGLVTEASSAKKVYGEKKNKSWRKAYILYDLV